MANLEGELEAVRNENSRHLITLQVLKAELAERGAEVERLTRSTDDLIIVRAERDQIEADLKAANILVEDLRNRLGDAVQQHETLQIFHESTGLNHARQQEAVLSRAELERHEIVSHWERSLRSSQEDAASQRDKDYSEAQAREQHLQEQLDAARQLLENETRSLRARNEALEGDKAGALRERNLLLEQMARLDAEPDECAEGESQYDRMLEENECHHRAEIDSLSHELRTSMQQTVIAVQNARELNQQLQLVAGELEDLKQQLVLDNPRTPPESLAVLRQELGRTRAERDRHAELCETAGHARQALEDQSRNECERLERELHEALRWEEVAIQREAELIVDIEDIRSKFDRERHDLEALHQLHQDESTALARKLEAVFQQQLGEETLRASTLAEKLATLRAELARHQADAAVERDGSREPVIEHEHAHERDFDAEHDPQVVAEYDRKITVQDGQASIDAEELRHEVSRLLEQLEGLQRERDLAIEQTGQLRLDRDRLNARLERMEALLQDVREQGRGAEQRAIESDDARRALEGADLRETQLRAQLDSLHALTLTATPEEEALAGQPQETHGRRDPMHQDPLITDQSAIDRESAVCPEVPVQPLFEGGLEPTAPDPTLHRALETAEATAPDCGSEETPECLENDEAVSAIPLADESPEARIQNLPGLCCVRPTNRGRETIYGLFFVRLGRFWKKSDSTRP